LVRSIGADEVVAYTTDDLSRIGKDFDAGVDLIGGETLDQMLRIMKPGAKIVSVAAVPEPQTALRDLGDGRILAALFWVISYGVSRWARRAGVGYRYLFMHPSGSDLAELADLIAQL
jgi:NADPH:quinone reductase-like Zn-dependent oxidoreductase